MQTHSASRPLVEVCKHQNFRRDRGGQKTGGRKEKKKNWDWEDEFSTPQFSRSRLLRCELPQFRQFTFSSRGLSEIKKSPLLPSFEVSLSHSNSSIRRMWKLKEGFDFSESAFPVTLCYMPADLKAKTEQHCHAVCPSHSAVSTSDSLLPLVTAGQPKWLVNKLGLGLNWGAAPLKKWWIFHFFFFFVWI